MTFFPFTQVKFLRRAIEHLMETSKQWQQQGGSGGEDAGDDDRQEMQEQVRSQLIGGNKSKEHKL